MSYPTQGASNRQIYDCCAYSQSLQQSVDPLQYQLYLQLSTITSFTITSFKITSFTITSFTITSYPITSL